MKALFAASTTPVVTVLPVVLVEEADGLALVAWTVLGTWPG